VGFGCDTRGPVPLSNENFNETKNKEVSYIWLLVILVILILVTGLIIKNRKKQNENK